VSGTDAVLIGENWISEHFFTTDANSQSFRAKVIERRKEWDAEPDNVGSIRSRFLHDRSELEATLTSLGETVTDRDEAQAAQRETERVRAEVVIADVTPALYRRLRTTFGYDARQGLTLRADGPLWWVSAPGLTTSSLVIVDARPVAAVEELLAKDLHTLSVPYAVDEKEQLVSVARILSRLFVAEQAPQFALVMAGNWMLVAEQERWAEGRYLAVDLLLVCERNDVKRGGEIDRALTCLDAASLAPDAEGNTWWAGVLAESVKHTVGVSKDLREGVRLSIEIIANDVVTRRRERGLPALPTDQAQPLAVQSLRFLYRILFLLYAEASPELGVLPIGAEEYERGYGLDRLRELTLVELATPGAMAGTHLYDSLRVLFRLVDRGSPGIEKEALEADVPRATEPTTVEGLPFRNLRADLFHPRATTHIDAVKLGNKSLQRVLRHLLLSKESRGRDRGFISYAELGINQLGAVYEGLMSFTGFFADEDLYEVAKDGDSSKGSWVVPVVRSQGIAEKDFVRAEDEVTGESRAVLHPKGTFVYRLAGRDRQQSASYYTAEVLTRFTVGQALAELLTENMSAAEILNLTVCEPALGSGAFAIEAVRQLAEQYLVRRQAELGIRLDPEVYPRRLQEVKAYIALHQVYGVDLNATAVELAEISLWLDTMTAGLDAPWFGLHLKRGNSLIGARRAVFRRSQVEKKTWLKDIPGDWPFQVGGTVPDLGGQVWHFLLPAEGWGSAVDANEAKDLAPEALESLKSWRRSLRTQPTKKQVDALVDLSERVERLWGFALARLRIAEQQIRRSIPVWGAGREWDTDALPVGGVVSREEIEKSLDDVNGAFGRVRLVMDAWCALWFWPLTNTLSDVYQDGGKLRIIPPTLGGWIEVLQLLLGRHEGGQLNAAGNPLRRGRPGGTLSLDLGSSWEELGDAEHNDRAFASARDVDGVLARYPWLDVCRRIAEQEGFFHWELFFAPVFADRGGFDLQVGNPPWVRPRSDVDALLAEGDPWWTLENKPSEVDRAARRPETLALPGIRDLVLDGTVDVAVTAAFAGDLQHYPHLVGLQPDLYRCFMEQTWRHASLQGMTSLIHLESHFTDEKAGLLRRATYRRLRRHWQFNNELKLFSEIENHKRYGVNVYGSDRVPEFTTSAALYHPDVVLRSLHHDGSGPEPGLKDDQEHWDVRPHAGRIVHVDEHTLTTWHQVLEEAGTPTEETRMLYTVNRAAAAALDKIAAAGRLSSLPLQFSAGWHEKNDRTKGRFVQKWGAPDSWDDVILQGPHIFVMNPLVKMPNVTMSSMRDWTATDFETLPSDAVPVTSYKPVDDRETYDARYTHWAVGDGNDVKSLPARGQYRLAWRRMAANTGERTLIPALIPPGTAHVDGISSAALPERPAQIVDVAGVLGSLLSDFSIRAVPKGDIRGSVVQRLAFPSESSPMWPELRLRVLRLNTVTDAYADLWKECWNDAFAVDVWTGTSQDSHRCLLGDVGHKWTRSTLLRVPAERRQAVLEIDALVALMLGVTADELCTVYRTQFPVLYGYDKNRDHYDVNGRLIPNSVLKVWRSKGDGIGDGDRTATNPAGNTYLYEPPFVTLDREHDMRVAHAEFERRLKERS
jgi:hypothetical protein